MTIIRVDTLASTNDYLKELAHRQVLEEGTVVATRNQTEGKGQRGNSWESEAGMNITCSILLYPSFLPLQRYFLLSEAVSLGVKQTLDAYTGGFTIKWPNDIYHNDRKIAGILIENELTGNAYSLSVVGIGVNILQEHFRSDALRPVSLKQITGRDYDLDVLLEELALSVVWNYEQLKTGGAEDIIRRYHEALYRRSGLHRYEDSEGAFLARIDRVSDDGLLHLVTDQEEERTYAFKSVRFVDLSDRGV